MLKNKNSFFVVGIGASAGGIEALKKFFGNLPDNPNAAFVVMQHLDPNSKSMMREILQRQTAMPVYTIEDEITIEPSKTYVLPPGKNLVLKGQSLCLEKARGSFASAVDKLFYSLAKEWGEKTIAIVLSGSVEDGNEGLEAISRAGGIALVQSPESAQFKSMPSSPILSGMVDEILSPEDLARTVFDLVRFADTYPSASPKEVNSIDPDRLQRILDILAEREDIDFSHYKINTLSRRINHRCTLTENRDIDSYIRLLESSGEEQKRLRQDMLIGATCFFRDRPAWEFLAKKILPKPIERIKPQQQLKIWVAACATGEEAYSMAMLVDEAISRSDKSIQVKIFATDLDTQALEIAAKGVYPESIANDISSERLEKYFTYNGSNYQVKRNLREMLIFAPHDLVKNAGFSGMSLVSCRNVLIYMQPQLQQQVLRLLHFALAKDGFLFLGSSETLGDLAGEFRAIEPKWNIFSKRRDASLSIMPIARQSTIAPIQTSLRTKTRQKQLDQLMGEVFKHCLAQRQMTCLLVDRENQLQRVYYNSANLLQIPLGEAILEVTEIVHPALKLPLSTALHRAKRDRESVLYTGIKINRDEIEQSISVKVGFDPNNPAIENYLIVVLEVESVSISPSVALRFDVGSEAAQQITELEYELQQTRENLQVTIEELETTNEEQQATNEELLASNEELQSTNEELQSVNEELYTVNSEYQNKIQELTQLNNDIDNLLRSTDIGVVFLDGNLNIRKFTPAAKRSINVKQSDLNRPLADLTNNLNCPDLLEILQQVLETQEAIEQEVNITRTDEKLLMRVNPYLRENGRSEGIVLTFVNIDELKTVQDQLHRANLLLENLYEISPVGLSLHDRNLKFLRINRSLADINGLPVAEHLGKTFREIVPQLADRIEPILHRVIETNQPACNVEIRGTTPADPDKIRVWSASYYPVDLLDGTRGVGAVVTEITSRIAIEEAIRDSEAKLIEAQRLARVGNWEIPVTKEFDLNQAKLLGSRELFKIYNLDPQVATTFSQLLDRHPPKTRAVLISAMKQLLDECTSYDLDLQFYREDGELGCINAIGRAICDEDGKVIKLYGTIVDVSDRKQIEDQLIRQNQALEEAIAVARAADSANQAKSEFLANISHEIRTPMNVVLGVSDLLLSSQLNSEQQNLLQTLKSNGKKLLEIINDVLDLSKIEARKLRLNPRDFELDTLLQSSIDSFRPDAEKKAIKLQLDLQKDLPLFLFGDDLRLQQVLSNLIGNAIKFTETGEVTIAVSRFPEAENNKANIVKLRFEVRDTGIGIAIEQQEKLFQPFTQADNSTTRQYGGTGLGLTISRRLVHLMKGEIGVESTSGQGSTFWFTVPFKQIDSSELREKTPSTKDPVSKSSPKSLKILIVEDYHDIRCILEFMLQKLGYQADWVGNGSEVVNRLAEEDYDLVFMDCQMPVMDGYQATQTIRQQEGQKRHTIIIGLTANAMRSDREKCLAVGMDDYLSKPVTLEDLDRILKKWSQNI
ncbi:MAG: CheR family methyltransferase [Prochloraceae cyanobacterium]